MEFKTLLGISAVVLNAFAFWPYIVDTVRRKTKPHMYSWLVWTLITGLVFIGQQADGAGAGAWATGITTIINLTVFLLSLRYGTSDITFSDKVCLASALGILVLWRISDSMALSIIMVTVIDVLAFGPTIRKSLKRPKEETFITYPVSSLRCSVGILAIEKYSLVTCAYPFAMLAMYLLLTGILLRQHPANWRKLQWRQMKRHYGGYFRQRPHFKSAAQIADE